MATSLIVVKHLNLNLTIVKYIRLLFDGSQFFVKENFVPILLELQQLSLLLLVLKLLLCAPKLPIAAYFQHVEIRHLGQFISIRHLTQYAVVALLILYRPRRLLPIAQYISEIPDIVDA